MKGDFYSVGFRIWLITSLAVLDLVLWCVWRNNRYKLELWCVFLFFMLPRSSACNTGTLNFILMILWFFFTFTQRYIWWSWKFRVIKPLETVMHVLKLIRCHKFMVNAVNFMAFFNNINITFVNRACKGFSIVVERSKSLETCSSFTHW